MLFIIQFPVADSRRFISGTGQLEQPTWDGLRINKDFVHFFGSASVRGSGIEDWIDEQSYIHAWHAIGVYNQLQATYGQTTKELFFPFRRFHFDGYAIGKFEVGIEFDKVEPLNFTSSQTKEMIQDMLDVPVTVRAISTTKKRIYKPYPLMTCDDALTRLYRSATTKSAGPTVDASNRWWVQRGDSSLFVIVCKDEAIAPVAGARELPVPKKYGIQLYHHLTHYKGRILPTWMMQITPDSDLVNARRLRIYLMHLHAMQECFRLVTSNIRTGRVVPERWTTESQDLQCYLNEARKYISRKLALLADRFQIEDPLEQAAQDILDQLQPRQKQMLAEAGQAAIEELDARLKEMDVRGNVRRNTVALAGKSNTAGGVTIDGNVQQLILSLVQGGVVMGDIHNEVHGDVIGGVVGGGTVQDSHAIVNKLSGADADTKQQLMDLFTQLHEALAQAPEAQKAQAADVAQKANKLVEVADDPESDKETVEFHANRLKEAAEKIKDALPTVLSIAGSIVGYALTFAAAHGAI